MELLARAQDLNLEEGEVGSKNRRKKPCRSVSLSCGLAILACVVMLVQAIISLIEHLTKQDEFWMTADKVIEIFQTRMNKTN